MAGRTYSQKGSNGRRRVLKGKGTFGIDADLSGLDDLLGQLEEDAADAVRPMAQAAAHRCSKRAVRSASRPWLRGSQSD